MFGLQSVQPTSRNSAAHLSTKQDDFTSIFSKALILKEILCLSVAKTEKWTTLVHFSDDFVSFDNKAALVRLLQERDIPLIEDDIFGDICYDEPRPRPARAFDSSGNVLLCGGFSKSLCPGLRLGRIAAGKFSEKVRALKYTTSMATGELHQTAVAEMLSGGGFALHLRRLKGALRSQQNALREAGPRNFPEGTEVSRPRGGFVLWVKLPAAGDVRVTMFEQARAEGIGFAPGRLFGQGGAYDDCLRLNAGYRWTSDLERAVERLGALAATSAAA
jgi:DNA-binding transcriptional MocR family regulator